MKSARITIAGMLATISLCGVAFALLRHPTPLAESAMLTVTFGVLLLSLLSAVLYRGGRRAFWTGFALFGWVYGLVNLGVGFGTGTSQQLVTTQAIYRLDRLLHPQQAGTPTNVTLWYDPVTVTSPNPAGGWVADLSTYSPSSSVSGRVNWAWPYPVSVCPNCGSVNSGVWNNPFLRIAQAFMTLLIALFGGISARVIYARARRYDRHVQDATSSPIALNESLRST